MYSYVMCYSSNVKLLIQSIDQTMIEKFWIVSKELEDENKTDQNNLNHFIDLFNDIPEFNNCEYNYVVGWLTININDPGYQVLDNDKIASLIQNQSEDEECDDSSSGENNSTHGQSTAEKFSAFESGLEWYKTCLP